MPRSLALAAVLALIVPASPAAPVPAERPSPLAEKVVGMWAAILPQSIPTTDTVLLRVTLFPDGTFAGEIIRFQNCGFSRERLSGRYKVSGDRLVVVVTSGETKRLVFGQERAFRIVTADGAVIELTDPESPDVLSLSLRRTETGEGAKGP